LLLADIRVDKIWTQAFRSTDVDADLVNRQFARITERAVAELRQEGYEGDPAIRRAINMRYLGQNYEHEIELAPGELDESARDEPFRRFARLHAGPYGSLIEDGVVELDSFKVPAMGPPPSPRLGAPEPAVGAASRLRSVFVRGAGFVEAVVVHRSA